MRTIGIVLACLVIGGLIAAAAADVLQSRAKRADEIAFYNDNIAKFERVLENCQASPDLRPTVVNAGKAIANLQRQYVDLIGQGFKTEQMVSDIGNALKAQLLAEATCAGAYNNLPSRP